VTIAYAIVRTVKPKASDTLTVLFRHSETRRPARAAAASKHQPETFQELSIDLLEDSYTPLSGFRVAAYLHVVRRNVQGVGPSSCDGRMGGTRVLRSVRVLVGRNLFPLGACLFSRTGKELATKRPSAGAAPKSNEPRWRGLRGGPNKLSRDYANSANLRAIAYPAIRGKNPIKKTRKYAWLHREPGVQLTRK